MRGTRWNWIRGGLALAGVCVCLGLQVLPVTAADKLQRFEFVQIRMGIPVRIVVYADQSESAIHATDAAYERIRQIDRALSDYDPESEVMQLCNHQPTGVPKAVSEDFFRVMRASKDLSARSGGAFDATVGPVVKLWRIARRKHALPDEQALRDALEKVGDRFVELDSDKRTITLKKAGMQLDFGGIAKGYAADEAYEVLKSHGLPIALIAVAGDLRVGDPPPDQKGWRVEVEDKTQPASEEHPPLVLSLANQAISTAGDTYQFLELNGVRYSHIVDPKTGLGITTPGSVSVIAPTGMQADGLDSTIVVLGPEGGLELIKDAAQSEALIIRLEKDGQRTVTKSPGWPLE